MLGALDPAEDRLWCVMVGVMLRKVLKPTCAREGEITVSGAHLFRSSHYSHLANDFAHFLEVLASRHVGPREKVLDEASADVVAPSTPGVGKPSYHCYRACSLTHPLTFCRAAC